MYKVFLYNLLLFARFSKTVFRVYIFHKLYSSPKHPCGLTLDSVQIYVRLYQLGFMFRPPWWYGNNIIWFILTLKSVAQCSLYVHRSSGIAIIRASWLSSWQPMLSLVSIVNPNLCILSYIWWKKHNSHMLHFLTHW